MRFAFLSVTLVLSGVADRASDPAAIEFFEKNVRPVLVEKCLSCHCGREGEGRPAPRHPRGACSRAANGGPAVVPGKPKESRLIDGDPRTPTTT